MVQPKTPMKLDAKQFVSKSGAPFDSTSMTGQRFVVTAKLPSGQLGRFVLRWTGGSR
jgi:hypothetical protein